MRKGFTEIFKMAKVWTMLPFLIPMTNVCYDSIVESGRGNHHSIKLRLKQKIEIQNGLTIQIQFKSITKGVIKSISKA